MQTYTCAILQGMARFLLQGGRVTVPEQRIARQCCRQQQRQSSQEAGMVIQAGDAGSPTWGRVGSCQRRGGVACERYLKEDAVELGNGLSVGSEKKNQILGKLPSSWLEGRNEDSHFLDSSLRSQVRLLTRYQVPGGAFFALPCGVEAQLTFTGTRQSVCVFSTSILQRKKLSHKPVDWCLEFPHLGLRKLRCGTGLPSSFDTLLHGCIRGIHSATTVYTMDLWGRWLSC